MDLFSLLSDTAWLAVAGGILGSLFTFLGVRTNTKKDLSIHSINERKQVSDAQYQLILELKELLQEQSEEIEQLKTEMRELQKINLTLMIENKELQFKIENLTNKLNEFQNKDDEEKGE